MLTAVASSSNTVGLYIYKGWLDVQVKNKTIQNIKGNISTLFDLVW